MAKNKTNRFYVLPKKLKTAIDEINFTTKKGRNKAAKFIFKLINDAMQSNFDLQKFNEIPSNYFRKVYGGYYKNEFLDILIESGIVQENTSYSTGNNSSKSFCKSYRINPTFNNPNDDFVLDNYFTEFSEKDENATKNLEFIPINTKYSITKSINSYFVSDMSIAYMLHESENNNFYLDSDNNNSNQVSNNNNSSTSISTTPIAYMLHEFKKSTLRSDLEGLYYNHDKIWEKTKEVVENINHKNFKVDEEIKEHYITVVNHITGQTREGATKSHLAWAKQNGYSLIQDKKHFYIDDLDHYITLKKKNILLNYKWYAEKLKKGIFYVSRSVSNNRLDHNLTSICSNSMDIIKSDNNLVEIDLKNSQFVIHANWMKAIGLSQKYQDVSEYYELCTQGNLYKGIAYMLHISEKEAKQLMMSLAFSSHKNNTAMKSKFKKRFPNVAKHMDDFKKEKGHHREFAIELQKREAQMFVDDLYINLRSLGFFCLTKHDSIIVKKEDVEEVAKIMKAYFKAINFECTMDVDGNIQRVTIDTDTPADSLHLQNQDETEKEIKRISEEFEDEFGDRIIPISDLTTNNDNLRFYLRL